MIGQTISHYKILEKLGEGGMGVVYKAEDTKLDRLVALKFLPQQITLSDEDKARFLQEAKAASAVMHPNVCVIHDIQDHQGQQFIVMEYVDGKTLKQMLPLQKVQTAVDYAIQIGEALQEAHSKGIVHRDIKTDNIMVNTKNQIKVMDFGLAKLKGSLKLTKTSSTVGTLAYMAPEQIQGEPVDARSDVFSFGVVLYEMLTGHLPFRGEHDAAMMYSILNEEPESLQRYLPDAPSELLHVLNRALEKEPDDRYQGVHDMVIDLRRLKKRTSRVSRAAPTLPRGDSQAASPQEPSEPPQVGKAARGKIKWVVAAALVIILCVTGWLLFRPEPRRAAFQAGHSVQLTSEPGIEIDPALSPDGKMIAYTSYFKGTLRIHVKQVTGGRTICLTDEMPGFQRFPQWSADGSEIAFYSLLSEGRYLVPRFDLFSVARYVVPVLGGAPRKIAAGTRSADGKRIAFTSGDTIYTQAIDGGKREKLAVVFEPHSLSWSSDGSLIACVSGNPHYLSSIALANIAPSSIYVITVSSGSLSQITDNTSLNMSPVWASDGRHLFFVSNRDGTRDIYSIAVDRSGQPAGTSERLTTGLNAHTISISTDSKMLAYSVLTSSANIWSVRIPESSSVSVKEATQVTTGNQVIEGLAISPDGQWLAYDCNRGGNQDIFKVLLKGGEPVQLTSDPRDDFLGSWSPDGKMIAFYSFRTGNRDLFVMLNDGSQQQQLTHDPAQDRHPEWSPDGNQLVFHSDKSGQQEIYVVSKKAGSMEWDSPRQITFDGGFHPRWSPDGLWIAYIANGLRVISSKGGTPRVLVSVSDPSTSLDPVFPAWSPDSRTIYYKAFDNAQRSSFWTVPSNGGRPRLLVKFDDPARQSNRPEFATDGKRFFFTISKYESDIWKMELMREE